MFKLNLSLLKWWRHLHYRQNNSQKQYEHRLFNAKPLKIFSKNPLQNSETLYPNIPWICGATCIIGKTIASLNVENFM